MFGSKTRRELATALAENATLRARSTALQTELAEAQARLVRSADEQQELRKHQTLLDGLLGNIPRFGESLAGVRLSSAGLSNQLNEDSSKALTAATESDANRSAFEKIASNLNAMFERISAAGNSVEDLARRAGEAGRGFAVVADEVRKLAERTDTRTAKTAARRPRASAPDILGRSVMNARIHAPSTAYPARITC